MTQEEQLLAIFQSFSQMNKTAGEKMVDIFSFTKPEAEALIANYTYGPKIHAYHVGISVNFLRNGKVHIPLAVGNIGFFKGVSYSIENAFLIKTIIENEKYIYVPDTSDSNVLNLKKYTQNNIRSAFFAPMFYNHKCIGVLAAVANEPHLFEGCCAVMYSFAQLIAQLYPDTVVS